MSILESKIPLIKEIELSQAPFHTFKLHIRGKKIDNDSVMCTDGMFIWLSIPKYFCRLYILSHIQYIHLL